MNTDANIHCATQQKNTVSSNSCLDLFLAIGQTPSSGSSESSTEFHFEELAAFIVIISDFMENNQSQN